VIAKLVKYSKGKPGESLNTELINPGFPLVEKTYSICGFEIFGSEEGEKTLTAGF